MFLDDPFLEVAQASGSWRTATWVTSWTSVKSALALTERTSGWMTSKTTRAVSGNSAPLQRRGRKALIGVNAKSPAPMGMIGPWAETL